MSVHPSDFMILLQPGLGNSGPAHWQSWWEASEPNCRRVLQRDWDHPACNEWVQAIARVVEELRQEAVLVAHSLGCLAAAHWALNASVPQQHRVRALMLVAPPDANGPLFPAQATGFSALPAAPLPIPTLVIASENDPYASADFARRMAEAWGARLVNIGAAGHINAASGLGSWPQGLTLLRAFVGEVSLGF